MVKTTDAASPEEYIDRLEEPRRTDLGGRGLLARRGLNLTDLCGNG
jgi:hypothetical protein